MIGVNQQIDKELYNRRVELRGVYGSGAGKNELTRILKRLGVFSEVSEDPKSIALHNEGIRMMDEMGLLDEEGIPFLVDWLINQPIAYKAPLD